MYLRRRETGWEALATAKLNLYLNVLGHRDDGYHELESLMVPIRLFDSLFFEVLSEPSRAVNLPIELFVRPMLLPGMNTSEPPVPGDERNLVVQALQLLQTRSGCRLGARLRLVKRIPSSSGLGGGSSNAAAALAVANVAWRLGLAGHELLRVAAEVGSDVPFFLADGWAICRGRGESVEAVKGLGSIHCVVVKPPVANSTNQVFHEYRRDETDTTNPRLCSHRLSQLISALRRGSLRDTGWAMINRLEPAAGRITPWVAHLRDQFTRLGLVAHQLTGSGSAYFGICHNAKHAAWIAAQLRTRRLGLVYATRSCQ